MPTVARWRPALRMAWRDLRLHRLRSAVVTLLVALPIAAAVIASTAVATHDYHSSNSLYSQYGAADARVSVTSWPGVRVTTYDQGRNVDWRKARGLTRDDHRDPGGVDVSTLLPSGSTTTRVGYIEVPLASGGTVSGRVVDLDSPLSTGLAEIESGRAPEAPGEAAVGRALADELRILDDGRLADDATLALADGSLRVVGLLRAQSSFDVGTIVVPPDTVLTSPTDAGDAYATVDYLVDLPDLSTAEARALQKSLAAQGASTWVRDAVEHPEGWGLGSAPPRPVSPDAVIVGALVIGLGLVEVLVLVGAAFAVGARRQSRTLGLLMASGGTPADVRRTVLAQGVWVGVVAAVVGVAGGALALVAGRAPLERAIDQRIHDYEISVGTIAAVALAGMVSAVTAAAIPAWGVGRMTASQALDGHVAAGTRRSTGRLRTPALALVCTGLVGLVACGPWIARTFAGSPAYASPVSVVVGALFALVLLVGTMLAIPTLVELSGRSLSRGWLPWRLATRDATRHRGRTWAAVLGIGIVTTGAVFAGFGVSAANAYADSGLDSIQELPTDTAEIYLDRNGARDPDTVARVVETAQRVLGADVIMTSSTAVSDGKVVVDRRGNQVLVVDDDWLQLAGVPTAAREAFADGTAIVMQPRIARNGVVELKVGRRGADIVGSLPAVEVSLDWDGYETYVSAAAATNLGLTLRPSDTIWAHAPGVAAEDEATQRLQLYGINAQAEYGGGAPAPAFVYAGAGGVIVLTGLVVGMIVALAAAEGRGDAATLAAVGAPPWTRRAMSAGHALFVGSLGAVVGLALGSAAGASLLQVVGTAGTPVPWGGLALLAVGVPVLCVVVGWVVAPGRLALTRRTA